MEDLAIVTKNGVVLRIENKNIPIQKRSGKGVNGIDLDDGDEVIGISLAMGPLTVATAKGKIISFSSNELRPLGRNSRGVRAIKLEEGDSVVAIV